MEDFSIIAARFLLIPVGLFCSKIDACLFLLSFHSFIVRGADYYYSILYYHELLYYTIQYYIQSFNTQTKVTVGMQGNLIHAVSYFARTKYDPNMTQIAANATRLKYNLSLVFELVDGILSLVLILLLSYSTQQLLALFTNFASLFFLQDIDTIGYALIEAGFFGRTMELWCHVIGRIELPRRNSVHGKVIERVTTSLFFGVVILLLLLYSLVSWSNHVRSPGDLFQGTNNTNSNN